jgi:hypothetical protein
MKPSMGTTPDPELAAPFNQATAAKQTRQNETEQGQDDAKAQAAQQPGGGGAPMTGAVDPSVPPSPGEGVTEQQVEESGLDDPGR